MKRMKRNDGGPAFPIPLNPGESYKEHGPADGMTLRDYFAAAAMLGYMTIIDERTYVGREKKFKDLSVGEWREALFSEDAELCYCYADAMLKARDE